MRTEPGGFRTQPRSCRRGFWLLSQGERIADLCAAPGGKTAQLALAGAQVVAVDRSAPRLARLDANMRRLGLAVETVAADAMPWAAGYAGEPFDGVLVDAPCTATGTIRRHPDVAWTKRPADIAALSSVQARLLDAAARLVRPGGRVVFCTCSLEPEEGEQQATAFLQRHRGFARLAAAGDWPAGFVNGSGEVRTAPDLWPESEVGTRPGLDGFFMCAFRRIEAS
jgi:16S rRNA (cytosine967-C5)-methyltransferase